jgi:hypothetical protein
MRTASSTPYHLGMLAKSTRGRRASITATNQPDQNSTLLLRLGSLLGSKQSRTRSSSLPQGTKLSREQRLRIAVALASAVLQFYNSPWLDETWSKKDIYFFFNGLNSDHRLVISSPYVSRSFVVSPTQDASQTNTTQETSIEAFQSSQIIDRTLFALGIVLIELCLNKTLEELRPETARPGSGLTIVDDYQLAIKQIEAVYEKGGSEYGYVCQRCLRCEFGVQDSKKRLDLDTFRHLVYEGVVAPLEEDLKKYSLYRGISV